jgi:hypothetical protein
MASADNVAVKASGGGGQSLCNVTHYPESCLKACRTVGSKECWDICSLSGHSIPHTNISVGLIPAACKTIVKMNLIISKTHL